jgi:hypothetical protein
MWTRFSVLAVASARALTGARLDRDFNDELQTHLAMLTEENVRRGLSPAEAARQASLRLGGVAQLEERNRDERSLPFLETTTQDLRFAIRTLKKNPAYASVAIATLAIGIGAGTTVYSLAGAVLLRPLPYADPSRLVRVFETNPLRNWTRNIASPANYADWKAQSTSFTDSAAYEQFNSEGSGATDVFPHGFGEPQALKSLGVTGNLFPRPRRRRRSWVAPSRTRKRSTARRASWCSAMARGRGCLPATRDHRQVGRAQRPHDDGGRRHAAEFLLPRSRRADLGAGGLRADGVRAQSASALSRRDRATETGVSLEQASQEMDADRPPPGTAIPRYEHQDGRTAGALPLQPGLRAAARTPDAQRRRRRALPDRLRQPREPPAWPRRGPHT